MEQAVIRVLLVDTNPPWTAGSMRRYGELVERTLSSAGPHTRAVEVRRLNIALPIDLPRWMPEGVRSWLNHLWVLLAGPFRIRKTGGDLVHLLDGSYAYLLDRTYCVPVTATVHDLIPALQHCGELGERAPSRLASGIVRRSLRGLDRCRRLMAVSRQSASDLVRLTDLGSDRIKVIPSAVDGAFFESALLNRERFASQAEAARPTVLHVGNNARYKNRCGAVRIFSRVREAMDARLVMAGPPPSPHLRGLVTRLGLEHAVEFVSVSGDAQLVELYSTASVFLFPSLYEGFGWPPLEAMACGCPVVCSNAASLPEVVGDAALTASPEDEQELASLCLSVLQDRTLAQRLSEKGRQRAQTFTVERMGLQLVAFYREVLND